VTAIYYGKVTPQSAASTTAAPGFPASNALLEALGRNWSGTGVGNETFDITMAAATQVYALQLHDVNFAVAAIQKSSNGIAFNAVGNLTSYAGRHGRRRGLIVFNDPNVKVARIIIAAGASTDGKPWRIGSANLFASKYALPFGPEYTYSVRTKRPQISTTLPNGVPSIARSGLNIDRIALTFKRKDIESFDPLIQQATAGTCAFDLELANYPEGVWPVRCLDDEVGEDFIAPTTSTIQVNLTEVVGAN
jgi:hypothetical protein